MSSFRVISVSRLHNQVFLFGHQADLVIPSFGIALVGRLAQVVLRPQFLRDVVVNLIDRLLLRDFVETAACLF